MKNAVILFLVAMGALSANLYAGSLHGAIVNRPLLSTAFKAKCGQSVCDRINYDNEDPLYFELKTLSNACKQYTEVLRMDPVVLTLVETNHCHCDCKF